MKFRNSKRDIQNYVQMKKDKRTNNYLQNITLTTKDRATGTPLRFWELLRFSGRAPVPGPLVTLVMLL